MFHLGDRLRKALDSSDVSVAEMADYVGYARETVGRYQNGHSRPPSWVIKTWAIKTGVDLEWLRTGVPSPRAE